MASLCASWMLSSPTTLISLTFFASTLPSLFWLCFHPVVLPKSKKFCLSAGAMDQKHKRIARRVCDHNLWLASIVLSPHLIAQSRLLAAASSHLLHSSGFRLPKHACTSEEQQGSPKRRKMEHYAQSCQVDAAPVPDPLQQLQQLACTGRVTQLEQLCEQSTGLDVNAACGAAGRTALHAAADAGCAAGVRALLGLGADSYCADDSGTSPLMLAAAGGHREAVKVLLEAGADPFHVNYSGVNPLMCAARCGSGPCIEALLEEGVDADYANTDLGGGEHALLLAAESGSVAAVRLLLAAGARLNRADKQGRTPLWAAARNGHALVVQLLLSQPHAKHIRSFGQRSTTPLQEAQAAHHTTCVALLSAHLGRQQQQERNVAVGKLRHHKLAGTKGSNSSSAQRPHPSAATQQIARTALVH